MTPGVCGGSGPLSSQWGPCSVLGLCSAVPRLHLHLHSQAGLVPVETASPGREPCGLQQLSLAFLPSPLGGGGEGPGEKVPHYALTEHPVSQQPSCLRPGARC